MDPKSFLAHARAMCRAKTLTRDGRRLTDTHVTILAKLAFWRGGNPTHQQLANATNRSRSTVQRALEIAHLLGLLSWTRRVVSTVGWRAQIANAYRLEGGKIEYSALRLRRSGDLAPPGFRPALRAGEIDLLAARRAEMARRLAG